MNYFADSAFEYIQSLVERQRDIGSSLSRILIMISSWPPDVSLELAKRLDGYCVQDGKLELVYKIAKNLASEWEGYPELQELRKRNWVDTLGNLTSYRNSSGLGGKKTGLVVLLGTDKVTDASGLADFHHCDINTIWNEQLQGTFKPWIESRLSRAQVAFDDETIIHFNDVLDTLRKQGMGDLVPISDLLDELPLEQNGVQNGKDAEQLLLSSLSKFGMPKFSCFNFSDRKSLPKYMDNAIRFFSYELFLEERNKEKALKAIEAYQQVKITDIENDLCFSSEQKGPYATDTEFLEGLSKYVSGGDSDTRDILRKCDFITIWDDILKFKKSVTKEAKETTKKLAGGPIDVVLTALWQTMRDFKREPDLKYSDVQKIAITSERFKHDYECEYEDHKVTALEQKQEASSHLSKLVGGIDQYFNSGSEANPLGGYLDLSEAFQGQPVSVESLLLNDQITFIYARTAEPALEFNITLWTTENKSFCRKFAWRLPATQSFRLADELITWAYDELHALSDTWRLPVFHVPYYQELIRAKDDDETRRVLLNCTRSDDVKISNLLSQQWIQTNDLLLPYLKKLTEKYAGLLDVAKNQGLHSVLLPENQGLSAWDDFRQAYEAAANAFVRNNQNAQPSPLAAMLMRGFLIVEQRPPNLGDSWTTAKYEPSAVATILHPAVLEMLEAQIKFLFVCFNRAAVEEFDAKPEKSFPLERWQNYLDLATIEMPLCGLISDGNFVLDTNIQGKELIHKIGSPNADDSPLSTRLLLRYEGFEDEDLADSEMFRETPESRLLSRLMLDYLDMHPQARDGISLAVYRNEDIQPVIAAIHNYLNNISSMGEKKINILNEQLRKPYSLEVTIFTESDDEITVSRWIEQWRERWEASESEEKFKPYRFCRLSIAHRILGGQGDYDQFRRMVTDSIEVDIAVLYNFIKAGRSENRFEIVDHYDITTRTLRFPILEKTFCAMSDPHHAKLRARIISNRQFRIGSLHSEIMAGIKSPNTPLGKEHVVMGFGDYAPWQNVINEFHKHAEWVICIDPNIDERLIKLCDDKSLVIREIIGFGSGVGSHGESNFTISTEQFSLSDISYRLTQSIRSLYPNWQPNIAADVTNSILREAQKLSGLSLVKATGIGTHIHDFMAYALARKLLKAEPICISDHLVTLDAYRHWFETAPSGERPDLLWVTASIDENGRFNFTLRVIECKLGQENQDYLDKAKQQIENGLRILIPAFSARSIDGKEKDDLRPDQRYWWLQLHRLIASKTEINYHDSAKVLAALERLSEGDYTIFWGAAVLAFWTDSPSKELSKIDTIEFTEFEEPVVIDVYSAGHDFVRELCENDESPGIIWQDNQSGKTEVPTVINPINTEGVVEKPLEEPVGKITVEIGKAPTPKGVRSEQSIPTTTINPEIMRIPDRILLGVIEKGARKVYWEFGHKELNNRHILVFGTSGMGKTYAIQCLLCELGKSGQNSLVIDYTNGFLPQQLEHETKKYLKPTQHSVREKPLPISPFKLQSQYFAEGVEPIKETPVSAAKRIASTFKKLYGTLGDQQMPIMIDAIYKGILQYGDIFTLEQFQSIIHSFLNDKEYDKSRVQSILNKLKPFILEKPFSHDINGISWNEIFNDNINKCHVFQFAGMDPDSSKLLVEFVLWDLNNFVRGVGNKDLPKVVVLDEAQNLDLTETSPVAKYLTEGRKFGLSLILATQTMENLKGEKLSRLFQAGHKLFFRPSENEFQEHAKLMQSSVGGSIPEWIAKLADLKKGECYSLGPSLNNATNRLEQNAFKISITALGARGFDA